ncbi:MAG: acetone carboxylase subunit gamma [Solirubrobacterales bacterium]
MSTNPNVSEREDAVHAVGEAYLVVKGSDGNRIECARCGADLGASDDDPKLNAAVAERTIDEVNDLNRFGAVDDLVVREFYCPSCGAMLAANVQRKGDPILRELKLA